MAASHILILSAKTKGQLDIRVQQLLGVFCHGGYGQKDFVDICYTLQVGREHMNARLAVIADTSEEAQKLLSMYQDGDLKSERIYMNTDTELLFTSGGSEAECAAFMKALVDNQKYGQIAELWTKGFDFDWEVLYRGRESLPHCVSLPSYPFEKERFWVRNLMPRAKQPAYEISVFHETWVSREIEVTEEKTYGHILVVLFQEVDRDKIQHDVNARKVTVISQPEKFADALEKAKHEDGGLDAVWYIDGGQAQEIYRQSVFLLQAIYSSGIHVPKILVFGSYGNHMERAYLDSCIGFERSLKFVMPKTEYHVIGIEKNMESLTHALRILRQEMCQPQGRSVMYEHQMRKVTMISPEQLDNGESILKPGGVYCVLGGAGGLGTIFCRWLSDKYHATVVALGRSPENSERPASLKREGSIAAYIQADLTDSEVLEYALRKVKKSYGGLDGILNCAGLAGGSSVMDKSFEDFASILRANVEGTLTLEETAKKVGVGFIAYFCSNAAILGDFGSCCYAVGKRFQQSFVMGLDQSLKRIVVNWPLWKSDGMTLGGEEADDYYMRASGQRLMQEELGTELFAKLLWQPKRQHLVFYAKLGQAAKIIAGLNGQNAKRSAPSIGSPGQSAENGTSMEKQCISDLKRLVFETIGLNSEKITGKADFAEMGFDSIALEEYVNRINRNFGLSLAPDIFFNYPTIRKLGKYLSDKYQAQLSQFYQCGQTEQLMQEPEQRMPIEASFQGYGCAETESAENNHMPEDPADAGRKKISIIGVSGRFPDARDVDGLWKILEQGKDVTQEITGERDRWFAGKTGAEGSVKAKRNIGAVPGVYEFDPLFFAISPRDAEQIDPRQRLLLEETWKALEDAGYGTELLRSERVGVFVGAEESDYGLGEGSKKGVVTSSMSALAGRIGYFLNLHGPVMVIDTACSSSLVAFNQACLAIQSGMCDAAIVAGASILCTERDYELMEQSKMISPDGICRAFGKGANGMVPAEAVCAVILKGAHKAREDGHQVYADVIGYGVNYDGRTNGLTAPSGDSQKNLITGIYASSGLEKSGTDVIVTHGTGTRLGDSIEINALSEAFADDKKERHCALVSFKPNIGHALAASGLVSLIGLLLAMKNKKIPATIHSEPVNEYINWDRSPFYLNRQLADWEKYGTKPRRAGISSFGLTGTNAHVLVEEAEVLMVDRAAKEKPSYVFCFSAKSMESLRLTMAAIKAWLEKDQVNALADISYTLGLGRIHLQYRVVILASRKEALLEAMDCFSAGEKAGNIFFGKVSNRFEKEDKCLKEIKAFALQQNVAVEKYEEDLKKLAQYYCEGYEETCQISCSCICPTRVHLPSYVFCNRDYQIQPGKHHAQKQSEITFQTVIYEDDFEKG